MKQTALLGLRDCNLPLFLLHEPFQLNRASHRGPSRFSFEQCSLLGNATC